MPGLMEEELCLSFDSCSWGRVFLASAPIVAHHAFSADFDINKPVKIQGIVTKVSGRIPMCGYA
jgi:hypothetical protein